jgi:hypothetical protein
MKLLALAILNDDININNISTENRIVNKFIEKPMYINVTNTCEVTNGINATTFHIHIAL